MNTRKLKDLVNAALGSLGVRLVNARWGPRGMFEALRRARQRGVTVRQIIDVGAASGEWTRDCLRVFPDARYLLIEPIADHRCELEDLARRHPNVTVWAGAAGASSDRRTLFLHSDQSSIYESEFGSGDSGPGTVVEVRPLDSFLGSLLERPPDLIKADTQGFELEVLKGADRCLEHAQAVLLEVWFQRVYERAPLAHEVVSYLGDKGFQIYDLCTYVQRPLDGEFASSDILFARADSPLFRTVGWARRRS